ncbi:DUF4870 family protein [Rhodoferax sp.]|jgi:uncharacterized membrane protein|uniref:DUF4870 family protein n=1 Tax=Rhodoferax sp. TaxID=50421 RepID=UPI002721C7C3|nr:hypothetical protein [Rhodoferax sp.]MDO9143050.1 hypothetical protein [Rhodoferax sp.]MDP1528179.1 hypothetical protein [Rhodoferax sp.]MDP1943113.1 hypothetical protein [Rhodoferax sp.]MDP2443132.1 hypothetical protein [Rhodoferax sp.]MDP3191237.1 hypothetical protein [Rhodoferax sp.]
MTQDSTPHNQTPHEGAAWRELDVQTLNGLNAWGTVSYVLHLIVAVGALIPGGQFGPVLLVIALVIDLVKRSDAEGSWHATHFSWRIRTVIIAALLYLVTAPLWLLFFLPGWLAWLGISVWFLYRIVSGMVRMNKGLPMEMSA